MKLIPGLNGMYYADRNGDIYSKMSGKIKKMVPCKTPQGYMAVCISCCKNKSQRVHRLVGMAYLPNPGNKPQINHIDNNRQNNRLENLEWCTQQENTLHAMRQGRQYIAKGEAHYEGKLSMSDVNTIKYVADNNFFGLKRRELAKIFGVSRTAIYYILNGRNWKCANLHISA